MLQIYGWTKILEILMFFLFQSQLNDSIFDRTGIIHYGSTSNYLCTKRLEKVLPVYLVLSPTIVAGIQFR